MRWQAYGDWGTSCLRLYRLEQGRVVARADGPGIHKLPAAPAVALRETLALLGPDRPAEIRLCGMAGARGGLAEVGYVECPADARKWSGAAASLQLDGIPLRIAAGLACRNDLPEVMRGEETQVFGALTVEPELGAVLLPGTHSKWVQVADGAITRIHTFLTGELFALLADQSTLAPAATGTAVDEEAGFAEGLTQALNGAGLAATLFATRALQLRENRSGRWASGFLSGLLIGDELGEVRRKGDLPDRVTVIGAPDLSDRYVQGLTQCCVAVQRLDGQDCALKGLGLLDEDD
ncbi:MAG: 2-dehydro-3-deoxygalactonokinase [Novosphingobium sp.]